MSLSQYSWLPYALASGAFAALNGVFAKLTTTTLTSSWSSVVSSLLGLEQHDRIIETTIRFGFFACNLMFNAVMWGLFTRALTLATSTVRVSVLNTSANFFVTAILGWGVFGEKLPALWWLGASLLVAGSVIIGRREESAEGRPEAKLAYEASEDVYSDGYNAPLKEAAGAGSGIEPKQAASVRSRDLDRQATG
nr:hypothetical protein B0A51_12454 [Rachicladosporium sp. CCFEE 5018]